MFHSFLLGPRQDIVSLVTLIGGHKVRKVHGRQGTVVFHVRIQLLLQIVVQYFRPFHGLSQIHLIDILTTPEYCGRVEHGQHVVRGGVNRVAANGTIAQFDGRCHHDTATIIGRFHPLFGGIPCKTQAIGNRPRHASTISKNVRINQSSSSSSYKQDKGRQRKRNKKQH